MKEIRLSNGAVVLCDDDKFEELAKYNWHFSKGYAVRSGVENGKRRKISMSRQIMAVNDPTLLVDHRNFNTLDNRKKNLRICTRQQNSQYRRCYNRTGYKGVSFCPGGRRSRDFEARIRVKGQTIYLGRFSTVLEASNAYDRTAILFFGDFALTRMRMALLRMRTEARPDLMSEEEPPQKISYAELFGRLEKAQSERVITMKKVKYSEICQRGIDP